MSDCWKRTYQSPKAAWRAVDRIKKRSHGRRTECSVYQCQWCRLWHLTSMRGEFRRWAL